MHLRAVARDAHPMAGREAGTSETRSFRIARPSEYDSVAVEPAPPPEVDKSLLSQRMLLMLTEKLETAAAALHVAVLREESRTLARDQARLRQAVGDAVFQRLTGEGGGGAFAFARRRPRSRRRSGRRQAGAFRRERAGHAGRGRRLPGDRHQQAAAGGVQRHVGRGSRAGAGGSARRDPVHAHRARGDRARAGRVAAVPAGAAADGDHRPRQGAPGGKGHGRPNARLARDRAAVPSAAREARLLARRVAGRRRSAAARDSLAVLRVEVACAMHRRSRRRCRRCWRPSRAGSGARPHGAFLRARRVLGGIERVPATTWSRGGPP